MQEDKGHWRTELVGEFNPDDYFGFIYRVTFLLTDEMYIGKKQFHRMNKYGTKRYGPSDWKKYTTSSDHVNALMREYPMECFSLEMLLLATTKAIFSYAECNILHKVDALTTVDDCWGLPKFLNKQIGPVRWITKDYPVNQVNWLVDQYLHYTPTEPR